MDRDAAELVVILLGVTSGVLLVAWGLLTAAAGVGTDPLFWVLAAAFLVYLAWDVRRHVLALRRRSAPPGKKGA